MQQFVYRGYEANDFETMFQLDEICFDPRFRFSRRAMRCFAEAENAQVAIAEATGVMVGFCIVHREASRSGASGYVVTLDVDPQWRRHGVAAALMQRAEFTAAQSGCIAMLLHVFTGNTDAIRFYERQGYELAGHEDAFYGADRNGTAIDAKVYRKPLSPH